MDIVLIEALEREEMETAIILAYVCLVANSWLTTATYQQQSNTFWFNCLYSHAAKFCYSSDNRKWSTWVSFGNATVIISELTLQTHTACSLKVDKFFMLVIHTYCLLQDSSKDLLTYCRKGGSDDIEIVAALLESGASLKVQTEVQSGWG